MSEPGWDPTSESGSTPDSPSELIGGPRPPGAGFPKVDWGAGAAPAPPADDFDEEETEGLENSLDGGDEGEDEVRGPADGEGQDAAARTPFQGVG